MKRGLAEYVALPPATSRAPPDEGWRSAPMKRGLKPIALPAAGRSEPGSEKVPR